MDYGQLGDPNFSPFGDTTAITTTLQQTYITNGVSHKFGVWVPVISYMSGDIIYHHDGTDGALYGSLVDQNRGKSPVNGAFWRKLVAVSGVGGGGSAGITGVKINNAGNYDNIVFGVGLTVSGNVITLATPGGGSIGDMQKSVYDSDADGKVNAAITADNVQWSGVLNKPPFARVATTGSYNDLSDKPNIPAAQVNSDWVATTGVSAILNKPLTFPPEAHLHNEYVTEAPITGVSYVRKDGAWVVTPTAESGMLISTTVTPGALKYDEIIFDQNFVVNGNTISLFQNGNIICGVNPNIRSVSQGTGIVANKGMVATAHSVNDTEMLTLRPENTYGNIFELVGVRPVTGAEGSAYFIAGLFDARTSDALNREAITGIETNVVADVGWDSAIGSVVGQRTIVTNNSGTASDKIDGIHVLYGAGTADVGSALSVSSNVMDKGFAIGLQMSGITGADSAFIRGTDTNGVPNSGIDFSGTNFVSGILLSGNCLTIYQYGVFDTPCTGKAVFNQGVDVTGNLNVSKIIFSDATEMTTAAIAGSLYWAAPYVGVDVPGAGNNTLTDGQSRIWHSPDGSHLITRKGSAYLGVQLTQYV